VYWKRGHWKYYTAPWFTQTSMVVVQCTLLQTLCMLKSVFARYNVHNLFIISYILLYYYTAES